MKGFQSRSLVLIIMAALHTLTRILRTLGSLQSSNVLRCEMVLPPASSVPLTPSPSAARFVSPAYMQAYLAIRSEQQRQPAKTINLQDYWMLCFPRSRISTFFASILVGRCALRAPSEPCSLTSIDIAPWQLSNSP